MHLRIGITFNGPYDSLPRITAGLTVNVHQHGIFRGSEVVFLHRFGERIAKRFYDLRIIGLVGIVQC